MNKSLMAALQALLLTLTASALALPHPERSPQEQCVDHIRTNHGENIFVDVLTEWTPSPLDNMGRWLSLHDKDTCHVKSWAEAKQYVENVVKEHHGKIVAKTVAARAGLFMAKPLVGSAISSVADIAQSVLQYYGHSHTTTVVGKLAGAVGHIVYGAHTMYRVFPEDGCLIPLVPGGGLGLGLWVFSEIHLTTALTDDIYNT